MLKNYDVAIPVISVPNKDFFKILVGFKILYYMMASKQNGLVLGENGCVFLVWWVWKWEVYLTCIIA